MGAIILDKTPAAPQASPLTEDNTLTDKPALVLLDQLGPFTPVLGNLGR